MQETLIPAGAWLKADGTVDITIGGTVLDGGCGVNMQTALGALRRYAAQHGPLLMTTLLPDGRSNMDTVGRDGTVAKYDSGQAAPLAPHGQGVLTPADDLDFFGLPPLAAGHTPPASMFRHTRVDAFNDRPSFRPAVHAAAAGFEAHLAARPPDRGLGAHHMHGRPAYHAVTVSVEVSGPARSLGAVAVDRASGARSPLRTVILVLVAILLACVLAVCGPMLLLRPGSTNPLDVWQSPVEAPAPPPKP